MTPTASTAGEAAAPSRQLLLQQRGARGIPFGTVMQFAVGLGYDARMYAGQGLNMLFDRHAGEQLVLVDALADTPPAGDRPGAGFPRRLPGRPAAPRIRRAARAR